MKKQLLMILIFILQFGGAAHANTALTIDEYISLAKSKNPLFKSYDLSVEATENKMQSAEIELSPVLTAGYLKSKDKSQPSTLASGERAVDQYSVGLAKKFFTGTSVKLDAQTNDFRNESPIIASLDKFATGAVGITVSQSLWKDFLGAGTRNKIERQKAATKIEMTVADLQRRTFLMQLESDFWDYVVSAEDVRSKKSNLDRAEKMKNWTAKRVSNGISDRADLMNINALAMLRQLQLQTAEEELKAQKIKFRENIGLPESEEVPEVKSDLSQERTYISDLLKQKNIVSIESEIAKYEALTKLHVAEEVKDQLRPDLSVFGSYGTTSYNREYSEAVQKITSSDYPKSAVGVNLSWVIETDAKSGLRDSASKESLAAQLKSEKKSVDGKIAWQDLQRKYELTRKNIKSLEQIAQFQRERSKAEQNKFLNGRTVTSNVVTAETDAAEAELTLLKAKAGLKKLESSGLLFTAIQ
jgi:outer membrane protein TolC